MTDNKPLVELLRDFEELNPGVRVVLEELPAGTDEQHQFYVINLQGGSADFDIFPMDVIWVQEFARAGWILPLDDLYSDEEEDDFFAGAREASIFDGKLYAVPWRIDAGVLYYRKDLLDEYKLTPPETWDELLDAANIITRHRPELYGFIWQGRQSEGLVCNILEYLWAYEGEVLREGRSVLYSEENLRALEFVRNLVAEHQITPEFVTTLSEEPSRRIFGSGKAVFMRNWPYAWNLFEQEGSLVSGKVGITAVPSRPGEVSQSTLGGWNLGVNRNSRYPELAKQLVKFLASAEAQRKIALEAGMPPARKSVYFDAELIRKEPLLKDLYPIFERARPRPVTPYYMMLSQVLQLEFSAVVSGIRSPEQALKAAEEQIGHILSIEE